MRQNLDFLNARGSDRMSYRIVSCPAEVLVGDPVSIVVERRGGVSGSGLDWIGLYPVSVPSLPGLSHGRWRYLSSGERDERGRTTVLFHGQSSALPSHSGAFEARVHCNNEYGEPVCKSTIHFLDAPISRVGRGAVLVLFLFTVHLMQLALNSKGGCAYLDPASHTDVIRDWLSEVTAPLNRLFVAQAAWGEAAQAGSSLLLDAGVLTLAYCATMRRSSVRSYCALFLFFALRFVAQLAATIPCPPGFIWPRGRIAGLDIPTLFVDYRIANDFFFSGHVGTALVVALELFQLDYPRLAWLYASLVTPLLAVLVVSFRAHRGIDCIAAVLAALVSCSVAEQFALAVDRALQIRRRKAATT
jgi:hypothetical protein